MSPRVQVGLLLTVGLADLVSTLICLERYGAGEANPLMAAPLERGTGVFIQVKLALLVAPMAVIEWARKRNPEFVRKAMHTCIVAYIALYAAGVSRANNPPPADPKASQPLTMADVREAWAEIGPAVIAAKKRYARAAAGWDRETFDEFEINDRSEK